MTDAAGAGGKRERMFSPADIKLYYESPFASFMEQMDREVPDHGITPDLLAAGVGGNDDVDPTRNSSFIEQLEAAGNSVVLIQNESHEAGRQLDTVNSMRAGANFIFNAHLSVVPLAGRIDILVRTPGPSRLGDYHYVPARFYHEDPALTHLPVELCCFVDMLEHLQGKCPEEFLQITNPNSPSPHIARLPAEGYMSDYLRLKTEYRAALLSFNPENVPDPSESKHWGRWSRHGRKILMRKARKTPAV
ncbi:MAG: hypothetical protein ABJ308_15075 [Halieaceae bacterium]